MSRIITFSQHYPSYHPRAGEPTYFVKKFFSFIWTFQNAETLPVPHALKSSFDSCHHPPKLHTIRGGDRFKAGDMFSPRVWGTDVNPKSGRSGSYHSKQIILAPDQRVVRVYRFVLTPGYFKIDNREYYGETKGDHEQLEEIAKNDGLTISDFNDWFMRSPNFKKTKLFEGQIICWKDPKY